MKAELVRSVLVVFGLMIVLATAALMSDGAVRTTFVGLAALAAVGWSTVYWPELLAMTYLFAGRYEFDVRLAPGGLPFSVNQLMFASILLLLAVYGRHLLQILRSLSGLGLLLFAGVLICGIGWTLGPEYGLTKVTRICGVVLPGVLLAMALVSSRRSVIPLLLAMFVVGLGLNSVALLNFSNSLDMTGRLTGLGSGPNVFSRTVGVSLLIATLLGLHLVQLRTRSRRQNLLLLVSALCFFWLLPGVVFAQSRGPVLALTAAAVFVISLSTYRTPRVLLAGVLVAGLAGALGDYILKNLVQNSRFDFSRGSNFASIDERQNLLVETWDLILARPLLGVGTGGWPVATLGIDDRRYPHNFFAEIASELGLVVAIALLLLFTAVLWRALRAFFATRDPARRSALLTAMALFIYFLVNIQISGDLIDNRMIWMFLGLTELATWLCRLPARGAAGASASPAVRLSPA